MPAIVFVAGGLLLLSLLLWSLNTRRTMHVQLGVYEQLLNTLSDAVLQLDRNGKIDQYNPAAAQLLGKRADELLGACVSDYLPTLQLNLETAATQCLEIVANSGHRLKIEARCLRLGHAKTLVLLQPSHEPCRSQEDIERFKRSQYFARIGTWDWEINTNRLYWSDAIYTMFGHKIGSVTPSYDLFCASVHPDDRERVRAGELRCIETGENHDEEYRVIWADGSMRWLRETGNVVKDAQGSAVKMMGVVRDITEEKAWAQQLHQLAHHDVLTGLPNRLVFEDRLGNALKRAQRNSTRVALVFIDLNGFKAINDAYGHAAGDEVLITTAQRLKGALRASDSVARIGGDEFVVIVEGLALNSSLEQEAQTISEKLFATLLAPLAIAGKSQCIGASLGVAAYPDHASSMDRLIHIADLAMYEAKRGGENQYRLGSKRSHD
ncbi:diguanylate cyclase [Pseudomonas sp. HMWF032]|uniref:diguanylate cyclase domain-containing protein n=1 Tax=unclassified Pseudomonas TaxID=196821 RepID=UPI000D34B098|nr:MULTISPECIES: diguanylate cyclase [unclassified Pseudomonas]PTS84310.1 diguanylate cyclase [Pseudomonas sp. HMWF032]PTT82590.1 diguanylate cyclase [Pseudomonas sp. HMWF010]WAC44302.1 diguanylate cyclase [Pseudomonas sp. SL4(2022)]